MCRFRDLFKRLVAAALGSALLAPPLPAQHVPLAGDGLNEVFVGSELESYLRLLQIGGRGEQYPWSIRSFSPREVERVVPTDDAHPWGARYPLRADSSRGLRVDWVPPRVRMVYNSAFPHGSNDGAVWSGKGLTTAVQGGFSARLGAISLTVAPVLFRAENAAFTLAPTEGGEFVDPMGLRIDLPQRFGNRPYTRIDPGQSTLRADARRIAVGLSTANQHWGPAVEQPLLLGNNAPGFLHAFVGTSQPFDLWVGRLHARVVYGRLEQSGYFPANDSVDGRFISGVVGVLMPAAIPGLEVGGARLFQSPWPASLGVEHFTEPFGAIFKVGTDDPGDTDESVRRIDQRASLFARWTAPSSGFEIYGEYGREDHNWDLRDLLLEPDHTSGFVLGFRKLWTSGERRFVTLRGEVLEAQPSHLHRVRHQGVFYTGSGIPEGHTHRGQIMGAPAGYGGSGLVVASDYYHPSGRWTVQLTRTLRHGPGNGRTFVRPDVLYGAGIDMLLFRGRFDVAAGVDGIRNQDPYREVSETNLHSTLRVRIGV